MVEFTYGVLKAVDEKAGYINFVTNVTPDCDCPSWSDQPVVPDQGIVAGEIRWQLNRQRWTW